MHSQHINKKNPPDFSEGFPPISMNEQDSIPVRTYACSDTL